MQENNDTSSRILNDLLLLFNMGFVAIIVLLVLIINDPKEKKEDSKAQGNIIVQIRWPDKQDCDVDLWLQAPYKNGYDLPVGYSNKGSVTFDLLRDDLGAHGDLLKTNQEIAYSKGIPDGEYTVNVHLFSARKGHHFENLQSSDPDAVHQYSSEDCEMPVPVEVEVGYKETIADSFVAIAADIVHLHFVGHEITAVRWKMKDKEFVPGSIHSAFKPLRAISYEKGK